MAGRRALRCTPDVTDQLHENVATVTVASMDWCASVDASVRRIRERSHSPPGACPDADLERFQQKHGVRLPLVYLRFLRGVGCDSGDFLRGSDLLSSASDERGRRRPRRHRAAASPRLDERFDEVGDFPLVFLRFGDHEGELLDLRSLDLLELVIRSARRRRSVTCFGLVTGVILSCASSCQMSSVSQQVLSPELLLAGGTGGSRAGVTRPCADATLGGVEADVFAEPEWTSGGSDAAADCANLGAAATHVDRPSVVDWVAPVAQTHFRATESTCPPSPQANASAAPASPGVARASPAANRAVATDTVIRGRPDFIRELYGCGSDFTTYASANAPYHPPPKRARRPCALGFSARLPSAARRPVAIPRHR
jgi:hypothetical protein